MIRTTIQSIIDRLEPITESGCLIWPIITKMGYGVVSHNGKQHLVHRLLYECLVGKIPLDMCLDHMCRVRCCVNVAHLEVVTIKTNVLRGKGLAAINSKKTHCVSGHPLSGNNLRKYKSERSCIECRKWYAKRSNGTLLLHSP